MKNFSLTISGIIIAVAGTLLVDYGFSESCSSEIITKIPLLAGGLMAWIGRVKAGGITVAGTRKR